MRQSAAAFVVTVSTVLGCARSFVAPKTWLVRRIILLAGAVLAAAPIAVNADGLRVQEAACQDGTCCPEEKSTCVVGTHAETNYYYKPKGSCKVATQT